MISKDSVECKICGEKFIQIINAHLKKHNITLDEYKKNYGKDSTMSLVRLKQMSSSTLGIKRPDQSKRMSGANNPIFGRKRTKEEKALMSQNRTGKAIGVAGKYERTDEIKDKIRKGVIEYYDSLPKRDTSKFIKYRNEVQRETLKWTDNLFKEWNGKCYYSGIMLVDTKRENNPLFPNIDHKISVVYGFKNNIDPIIIGNIDNLCISSSRYNGMKHHRTETEFVIYYANLILKGLK